MYSFPKARVDSYSSSISGGNVFILLINEKLLFPRTIILKYGHRRTYLKSPPILDIEMCPSLRGRNQSDPGHAWMGVD